MRHTTPRFSLLAMLAATLAACLFLPGLNGGFVFDDKPNIVDNAALHITAPDAAQLQHASFSFEPGHGSRPLAMLSFALDYLRAGLNPQAFKTTNLLIHALTTLALAHFLRLLLTLAQWPPRRATIGALAITALWAIHPLQVSSVLYVVQRMQTLVTLFTILALWAYLRMRQAQLEDQRSRQFGVLMLLFWVLALASKEDAILLPAFTLALELTVLRFGTARATPNTTLQRSYAALVLAGLAVFFLVALPYYWHWDNYPTREFSSSERLLTQGRALVLYLQQILLPLPGSMPFFYDDYPISRGWLQPPTTLAAWLLVAALLAWAWRWRTHRPLFSLGIFLFLAGHAITSNVIGLELVFEHRNHFPMIGILLSAADLCVMGYQHRPLRAPLAISLTTIALLATGSATAQRAHAWGDPLRFAQGSVAASPHSARAWMTLGGIYYERSGGKAGNPWLDKAIEINQQGARETASAPMLSNIVIFKTIRGDATPSDWAQFLDRLQQVPMNAQNKGIAFITLDNVDRGIPLDESGVIKTLETVSRRATLTAGEYLRIAAYLHNETQQPGKALPYLRSAVEHSPPDDPAIAQLLVQLKEAGREDWVNELSALQRSIHE